MTKIVFEAMPAADARHIWDGGTDAYDLPPEVAISDGDSVPCRHCLMPIDRGESYYVFAYKPFASRQPYAETGPIFLHRQPCKRALCAGEAPVILDSPYYILRGYNADERIVYGTGGVVARRSIVDHAIDLLANESVDFVDVRSAANNCFQCRIRRSAEGS